MVLKAQEFFEMSRHKFYRCQDLMSWSNVHPHRSVDGIQTERGPSSLLFHKVWAFWQMFQSTSSQQVSMQLAYSHLENVAKEF